MFRDGGNRQVVRQTRFLLMLTLLLCASGCMAGRATGVPWWKGAPAMVVAPNSQEAEVWREYKHMDKGCSLPYEPAPIGPNFNPNLGG